MFDETILDCPDGKISKLMELAEYRGREVFVVYHARYWARTSDAGFGYVGTTGSFVSPWRVGGFVKYNSGGGMKGFRPRRELPDEAIFLVDQNEMNFHTARILPLKQYNIGERLPANFGNAIFSDQNLAEAYQVSLAMMFEHTYPRNIVDDVWMRVLSSMVKW